MDWITTLNEAAQTLLPLAATALAVTLIYYIGKMIKKGQDKIDNDLVDKYLGRLDETITNVVLATTQTYVESLKNKNMFTEEAQKEAFQRTYNAVMKTLNDEAKKYIASAVGDIETYITNKIEATVKMTK